MHQFINKPKLWYFKCHIFYSALIGDIILMGHVSQFKQMFFKSPNKQKVSRTITYIC